MRLLEEIAELQETGKETILERKAAKKKADADAKKKLKMKRQGEDIRIRAMQRLNEGNYL